MRRISPLLSAVLALATWSPVHAAAPPAAPAPDLAAQLATLAARAKGTVGIAVTHIESGRSTTWNADQALPTFSVMKLPVAVALLTDVATGRLSLDKPLHVTRADVVGGAPGSEQRWADVPKDMTVKQLLELSLVFSDNTSSDKLMTLLGGPAGVSRRLEKLHIDGLQVRGDYHTDDPKRLNLGTAGAVARLLTRMWQGQLLTRPQQELVVDMMTRSPNGARRLRAQLPPAPWSATRPAREATAAGPTTSASSRFPRARATSPSRC
jgi:beta-lactamase class A